MRREESTAILRSLNKQGQTESSLQVEELALYKSRPFIHGNTREGRTYMHRCREMNRYS